MKHLKIVNVLGQSGPREKKKRGDEGNVKVCPSTRAVHLRRLNREAVKRVAYAPTTRLHNANGSSSCSRRTKSVTARFPATTSHTASPSDTQISCWGTASHATYCPQSVLILPVTRSIFSPQRFAPLSRRCCSPE